MLLDLRLGPGLLGSVLLLAKESRGGAWLIVSEVWGLTVRRRQLPALSLSRSEVGILVDVRSGSRIGSRCLETRILSCTG